MHCVTQTLGGITEICRVICRNLPYCFKNCRLYNNWYDMWA